MSSTICKTYMLHLYLYRGILKSCEVSWIRGQQQSELDVQKLFQTIVRRLNIKVPGEQKRYVGIPGSVANYCSDMLCVVKH
jgi:hypothetical protein